MQTLDRPPRTAILYGSLTSPNFRDLHEYLLSIASKPFPHLEYIFRHIPPTISSGQSYLSGYGVALDLKKTDYLAVDDRHANHRGILFHIMSVDLTKFPFAAQGEKDISESGDEFVDEDHILTLLDTYPENDTAADQSVPLTTEELSCNAHPPLAIELY
jgi:UDP-glucose:glycoprotein glucosyltransferase